MTHEGSWSLSEDGALRPSGVAADAWPGVGVGAGNGARLLAEGHLLLTPVGTDEERPASRCPVHFPCLLLAIFFIGDGVSAQSAGLPAGFTQLAAALGSL